MNKSWPLDWSALSDVDGEPLLIELTSASQWELPQAPQEAIEPYGGGFEVTPTEGALINSAVHGQVSCAWESTEF